MVAVESRHHETDIAPGSPARHSGPAGLANAASRQDARLGHFRADRTNLAGSAAGEPGIALPGPASPGASGLDCGRVGRQRAGPPGPLLPAHAARAQTSGAGVGELGETG